MLYEFVYIFLFLIFLFWIVFFFFFLIFSITYSLNIYLFWHFQSFNIWICVSFCNIWTCVADFNDYTMYYSFEGNLFIIFFYISLLCNHIYFVLFQKILWFFNIFWLFKSLNIWIILLIVTHLSLIFFYCVVIYILFCFNNF